METLLLCTRPFGLALAILSFLNFAAALRSPNLAATRIWLYLDLPEPWVAGIAVLLGIALLIPRRALRKGGPRRFFIWTVGAFAMPVAANAVAFWRALAAGEIRTTVPVPFSLCILAVLAAELARALSARNAKPLRGKRRIILALGIPLAFWVLTLAHIVTFGKTDYRRGADAIVVLGAKVDERGELSDALAWRMETGVNLFRERRAPLLILSGGTGENGRSEPQAMAAFACARGVPRKAIILDEDGVNTWRSAQNTLAIARERGIRTVLVVSQYFHNARVRLIFERVGLACYTVPAGDRRPLRKEPYFVLRETVAFPFYYFLRG
ncbi:MAG: YdcF family protein [Planctomycetes bacterium]|nr:YdcF family protein [Planctomycetota bacterium]